MEFRNLAELHRRQAERLGPRSALRYKKHGLYRDRSWASYREQAVAGACALVWAGVERGDRVGLLAENSVDWLTADMAILTAGAATVSPHAPLTARQVHYQLADAGVCYVIVSNAEQLAKVLQVRAELPALRGIFVFDPNAVKDLAIPWSSFCQAGRSSLNRLRKEVRLRERLLGPDDLAAVVYTSGTTGNPKGVTLTHGNLVSNSLACLEVQPHRLSDVVLSWLPLTHIYARTIDHYCCLAAGVTVALAESAETMVENLEEVQPSHLAGVPRFYEKILSAVACPDQEESNRRLRKIFGPRLDWMSSGGAPLPTSIAQAYHAAGLLLLQGYGLTESSPVISFNSKAHNKLGTVGKPLPGVEVRIGPDGEILTRGPHVMQGYWNDPTATAETIRDGWLHTGDLGSIDDDGFLSITGRKKELMVLSNGKKVVPSHLEGLIQADPCVDQVLVVGEGRNFLTALVVPHWHNVAAALGSAANPLDGSPVKWASNPLVRDLLLERIRQALKDLSRLEQVQKILILPEPFTVAADEMTVSLKLRRNFILSRYGPQLDRLYGE
jgi:long-chain acyl-CoA synthetase